jgi:hypothetical protein
MVCVDMSMAALSNREPPFVQPSTPGALPCWCSHGHAEACFARWCSEPHMLFWFVKECDLRKFWAMVGKAR